jgi:hypothetical protein
MMTAEYEIKSALGLQVHLSLASGLRPQPSHPLLLPSGPRLDVLPAESLQARLHLPQLCAQVAICRLTAEALIRTCTTRASAPLTPLHPLSASPPNWFHTQLSKIRNRKLVSRACHRLSLARLSILRTTLRMERRMLQQHSITINNAGGRGAAGGGAGGGGGRSSTRLTGLPPRPLECAHVDRLKTASAGACKS